MGNSMVDQRKAPKLVAAYILGRGPSDNKDVKDARLGLKLNADNI